MSSKKFTHHLLIAAIGFAVILVGNSSRAANSCLNIFNKVSTVSNKPLLGTAVYPYQMPLPPELLSAIDSSPSVKKLREKFRLGEDLRISLGRIGIYESAKYKIGFGYVGETIQTLFVKKILERIFPHADFNHTEPNLEFSLHDSAEDPSLKFGWNNHQYIQMAVAKRANITGRLSNAEIMYWRKYFKLNLDKKTVSVQVPSVSRKDTVIKIIEQLLLDPSIENIIISDAGGHGYVKSFFEKNRKDENVEFVNLTQVRNLPKVENRVRIISNNTTGRMNIVNSIADAAVTFGAVNFFEPLNHGTPTVILNGPDFVGTYDNKMLENMVETAKLSSGARAILSLGEINESINWAFEKGRGSYAPGLLVGENHSTAVEIFLEHLASKVILQYENQ